MGNALARTSSLTRSRNLRPKGVSWRPNVIADLQHAAAETPWSLTYIGEWGHPRNQMMAKAEKPQT